MKITNEDDNDDGDDDDDDSCDGLDQPLYLIPVEGEGVHRVEADRAIILCHNVLQCVTMSQTCHHPVSRCVSCFLATYWHQSQYSSAIHHSFVTKKPIT